MSASKHSWPPRPEVIPDNPIAAAALMLRELHEKNIDMMDGGHLFIKNGELINDDIRGRCLHEISMCDQVIERSASIHNSVKGRGASLIAKDLIEEVEIAKVMLGDQKE